MSKSFQVFHFVLTCILMVLVSVSLGLLWAKTDSDRDHATTRRLHSWLQTQWAIEAVNRRCDLGGLPQVTPQQIEREAALRQGP